MKMYISACCALKSLFCCVSLRSFFSDLTVLPIFPHFPNIDLEIEVRKLTHTQ